MCIVQLPTSKGHVRVRYLTQGAFRAHYWCWKIAFVDASLSASIRRRVLVFHVHERVHKCTFGDPFSLQDASWTHTDVFVTCGKLAGWFVHMYNMHPNFERSSNGENCACYNRILRYLGVAAVITYLWWMCEIGSNAAHNAWKGQDTGQWNNRSVSDVQLLM